MKVNLNVKYNSFVHSKAMLWCHKHLFLTVANDLVKDVNFITIFSRRKLAASEKNKISATLLHLYSFSSSITTGFYSFGEKHDWI